MTREELKERYRQFSLRIIKMVANYRAACLAKSDKDFINKLKMVEEEIDETNHWLSIIIDSGMLPKNRVQDLYDESLELGKITTKSIITAKSKVDI